MSSSTNASTNAKLFDTLSSEVEKWGTAKERKRSIPHSDDSHSITDGWPGSSSTGAPTGRLGAVKERQKREYKS